MKKINKSRLWISAAPLMFAVSGNLSSVNAQVNGAEEASNGDVQATGSEEALEDIVVTARKRSEGLQDAPIAISAITSKGLEDRGITNTSELAASTPNLVFGTSTGTSGSNSASAIFIRGIGQVDYTLNTDPGVGVYIDGVYVARSLGSILDLADVERVEILRGPQGVLFGRNTIGGAISVTTAKPTGELQGSAELTGGGYNLFGARGMINIPISSRLMFRAVAGRTRRDGYVLQIPTGKDLGDDNSLVGRATLRWLPTDNVDISLSVDGTRTRENGAPLVGVAINGSAPFAAFYNGAVAGALGCAPPPGPLNNSNCYNSGQLTGSRFSTNSANALRSNLDVLGGSLNIEVDLGGAKVKSITAYRELDSHSARDDHAPVKVAETTIDLTHRQFSQELQLAGRSFGGSLDWTTGIYYFDEKGSEQNVVNFSVVDILSGGNVHNNSFAVFGQATYTILPGLSLTAGARYTTDTKRFTPDQIVLAAYTPNVPPVGTFVLPNVEVVNKSEKFTPMATLSYKWTSDIMTYATYSEGFKGGGFTQRVFPPLPETPQFKPEFVKVYEIGAKTSFFDNRLRLNSAVFHTDYSNLQINVLQGVAPVTRNAGKARIDGAELEVTAALLKGLLLDFGLGYLDAKYQEVDPAAVGVTVNSTLANTAKWTVSGGLSYKLELGGIGELTPHVDWSYRSHTFNDAINSPAIAQPGYHVVNASLAFETLDGQTRFVLAGTNLTNESYILGGFADLRTSGFAEAAYSRPRSWSISVRHNF